MSTGIEKQALQGFQPLSHHQNACLVKRDHKVVLSRDDIKNGWTTGYNQNEGRSGNVPLQIFEPPAIAFNIGTSNISVGTLIDNTLSFIPINRVNINENCVGFTENEIYLGRNLEYKVKGLNLFADIDVEVDDYYLTKMNITKENGLNVFEKDGFKRSCHSVFTSLVTFLKTEADGYLKQRSTRAVFIISSTFNYHQKLFYYQAARSSGFGEIKFISKSNAIALSLPLPQSSSNIMVLSVGAQNTELSMYNYKSNYKPIVCETIEKFGGYYITGLVFNFVKKMLQLKGVQWPESQNIHLLEQCEHAKIELSSSTTATIVFKGETISITRKIFESLLSPFFRKLGEFVDTCFLKSRLDAEQLSCVYIGGNTCRLPGISHMLTEKFNQTPVRMVESDSYLKGAAQFMASLPGDELIEFGGFKRAYGVKAFDYMFSPVLPINSMNRKNQCSFNSKSDVYCKLSIYEGKNLDCSKNLFVGNIVIDSIPMLRYSTLKVVMEVSTSDILKVYVLDNLKTIHVEEFNQLEKIVSLPPDSNLPANCYPIPVDSGDLRAGLGVSNAFQPSNDKQDSLLQAIQILKAELENGVRTSILNSNMTRKIYKQNEFFYLFKQIQSTEFPTSMYDPKVSPVQYLVQHLISQNFYQILDSAVQVKNGKLFKPALWVSTEREIHQILLNLDSMDVASDMKECRKIIVNYCILLQRALGVLESVYAPTGSDTKEVLAIELIENLDQISNYAGEFESLPFKLGTKFENQINKINNVISRLKKSSPEANLVGNVTDLPELRSYQKLVNLHQDLTQYIQQNHNTTLEVVIIVHEGMIRPEHNKPLYLYEDFLLKFQLKLDSVDTVGNAELRAIRKSIIDYCQFHLDEIDALKSLFLE